MFHLSDVRPLSDFKRSQAELLQHLKTTGRPLLLTLNGRAEVVVQDAESYQKLLERAGSRGENASPRLTTQRQSKRGSQR
jgi:prevent-host-death family protein